MTRSRLPRPLRLAPVLALGLVAVLVLAGCAETPRVGAAAIVGDERLTVTQLQDNVARVLAERQAAAEEGADTDRGDVASGDLQRELLGRWIQGQLLEVVARRLGVPAVTDGQVDEAIAGVRQQGGDELVQQRAVELSIASGDLRDFVRNEALAFAVFAKLGPAPQSQEEADALQARLSEELAKAADEVGVRVNPRYGRWDRESRSVVRGDDGLTEPADGSAGDSFGPAGAGSGDAGTGDPGTGG